MNQVFTCAKALKAWAVGWALLRGTFEFQRWAEHGVLRLFLNLEDSNATTDATLASLANQLPRTLKDFSLNLSGCEFITDSGMQALSKRLPSGLQAMEICLRRCVLFTGVGFAPFVPHLERM